MIDPPAPLVPAEVDLRDFAFMPLDVVRLRDSDLAASETPESCWAAVLLWAASWHQVPAGSIPSDERWIAKHAGYAQRGKIAREWTEVRRGALRGFVLCSDGRLYHPVVSEKAREAWRGKLKQRHTTECARIKKHNQRHGMSLPIPSLEEWMSSGCPWGQSLPVLGDKAGTSNECPGEVSGEEASKGQGEGQGEGNIKEMAGKPASAQAREPASLPSMGDQEFEAACRHAIAGWDPPKGSFGVMLNLDFDRGEVVAVLRQEAGSRTKPVGSWKLWAEDVVPERIRYAQGKAASSAPALPTVFVAENTPEWEAWDRYGRANDHPRGYPNHAQDGGRRGWRFPSSWPPGTTLAADNSSARGAA